MKKTLAVIVAVLVALTVFASATKEQVVILNNALPTFESSYQNYNAFYWTDAYSMADIVKDNFWHQPSDTTVTITGSADSFVPGVETMLWGADESQVGTYKTVFGFKDRFVAFQYMVPTEEYDVYLGKGVEKKGSEVQYMNYSIIGDEAVLFFTWEINVSELITAMSDNAGKKIVDASSWKVVDVDGNEVTVNKNEILSAQFTTDGKTVDLATSKQTIKSVQSIAPADATPETVAEEDEVLRFVVALDAKGVYGEEPKYNESRNGYYYPRPWEAWSDAKITGCYSLSEIFKKYGVKEGTDFVSESYLDGFSRDEAWDWISQKYITFDNRSGHEVITVGKVQSKSDDSMWNIGYLKSDKHVFAYIPETGLKLADAFARLSIDHDVKYVAITYLDGTTDNVKYETACGLVINQDSTIVSVALY